MPRQEASKKRLVMATEMGNDLRSKADFIKYFKQACKWLAWCVNFVKCNSMSLRRP